MWPFSPQWHWPLPPTVGWVEGMYPGLCGSSWVSQGLEGKRPSVTHRQLFIAPGQRQKEKCVHTGTQNQAQEPSLASQGHKAQKPVKRGVLQFLHEKGEGDCAGEGLWQLSGPQCLPSVLGVTQGNFSLLDLFPLLLVCMFRDAHCFQYQHKES